MTTTTVTAHHEFVQTSCEVIGLKGTWGFLKEKWFGMKVMFCCWDIFVCMSSKRRHRTRVFSIFLMSTSSWISKPIDKALFFELSLIQWTGSVFSYSIAQIPAWQQFWIFRKVWCLPFEIDFVIDKFRSFVSVFSLLIWLFCIRLYSKRVLRMLLCFCPELLVYYL